MIATLQSWVRAGWLRELDAVLAGFLQREAPQADPLLLLAAALASHQLGRGQVCLDLQVVLADAADVLAIPPEDGGGQEDAAPVTPAQLLAPVNLQQWQAALGDPRLVGAGPGDTPLVLQGTRLYLRRFWQHEQAVRSAIAERLAPQPPDAEPAATRRALDALFGPRGGADGEPDWQKIACALALRSRFTVITGGPGSGKTTTVVKLLALLQHLAMAGGEGRRLRIRLAAPTGKAAARLNTSIANALEKLPLQHLGQGEGEALRAGIPGEASTVHRLLGSVGGSRRFRYGAGQPLPLDVLVLDEASMVDLETMAAVLAALPAASRLVLLGDKDQLASVEAGGVLGALCRRADAGHYRADTRDWLQAVSGEAIPAALLDAAGAPLDQAVVKLRRSYRFDAGSGIGQLAEAVNQGDAARVQALQREGRADLAWMELAHGDAALRRLVLDGDRNAFTGQGGGRVVQGRAVAPPVGYRHYLERIAQAPPAGAPQQAWDAWARAVLQAHGEFQLLCAVRRGPYGVEGLNQRIAALLHAEGLTPAASGWYLGRPVMVTENDYGLGLMNGDVGITLALPAPAVAQDPAVPLLRVAFAGSDGAIRWVLPSRLRQVETVFAMTVHKSQGSEFGHAALLLPAQRSRVLTRELVYTGITRARHWFTLAGVAPTQRLEEAIRTPTRRASGLAAGWAPEGKPA